MQRSPVRAQHRIRHLIAGLTLAATATFGVVAAAEDAPAAPAAAAPAAPAQPAAPSHPDVQRALAYVVPETTCTPPDIPRNNNNAGTFQRIERMTKRYIKCLEGYQQALFTDFQFLRDSVRHGVTMAQAETIAANLAKVAETIKGLQAKGVVIAQDQARIISSQISGNRSMPGAENH